MQTSDFNVVFQRLPHVHRKFLGAFALDLIPANLKINDCLIFNLDKSYQRGSHWLGLLCSGPGFYEIFDSQGNSVENLSKILNVPIENITLNHNAVQLPTTNSCGLFAAYFLIHRLMNLDYDFSELLDEIFDTNKNYNEYLVADFFNNLQ